MKIAISICTFNRPQGLKRLLESLFELEFSKCKNPNIIIIVIDNEGNGTIEPLIKEVEEKFHAKILFDTEPIQGIASARNRAIKLANDSDFIAFIDDDEIADKFWLDELLFLQKEKNADMVSGPVIPLYEASPPIWIIKGKFFERKNFPNEFEMNYAATNNLLVKSELLKDNSAPFDTRFNLTGSSDTFFTMGKIKDGAKCYWARNAIVYEYNPPKRLDVRWILLRALRSGLTITTIEILFEKSLTTIFSRFLKAIYHILLGFLLLVPLWIINGYAGFVKSLTYLSRGIGEAMGLLNLSYEEYKSK